MKLISKTVTPCIPTAQGGKTTRTTDDTTVLVNKFQKNNGVTVCTALKQQADAEWKCQGTVGKKQWINGTLEYEPT
jgi:hypothetical protein